MTVQTPLQLARRAAYGIALLPTMSEAAVLPFSRKATLKTDLNHELNLAAELNRLLGDLNCEMAVLPSKRTIETWYRTDVLYAVIRCKDALLEAQRCALRLARLGDLEQISINFLDELVELEVRYRDRLEHVSYDLARQAHRDTIS